MNEYEVNKELDRLKIEYLENIDELLMTKAYFESFNNDEDAYGADAEMSSWLLKDASKALREKFHAVKATREKMDKLTGKLIEFAARKLKGR